VIYVLANAFMRNLDEYADHEMLYIGMDRRRPEEIQFTDTLLAVAPFEPTSPAYRRIAVDTKEGFSLMFDGDNPRLFTSVEWVIPRGVEDIGLVRNSFLCTAPDGTDGKLLLSVTHDRERTIIEGSRFSFDLTFGFKELAL